MNPALFSGDENVLFRPFDESRMLGHFQFNSLPRLAERIGGDGFIEAGIAVQHPVDEKSQLPVSQVREIVTSAHLDRLIVEEELDRRLRISVDVPEKRRALIFGSVLHIRFLFLWIVK